MTHKSKNVYVYSFIVCLLFAAIGITLELFAKTNIDLDRQANVIYALLVDVVLMFGLLSIISRDFIKTWHLRRTQGSVLQLKLIMIFAALAVIPSFLMIFFSAIFFHKGIESWFNFRNNTVLSESVLVAESYLNEHKKIIKDDGLGIAKILEITLASLTPAQINDDQIVAETAAELMNELFDMKGINGGLLFAEDNQVLARSKYSASLTFAATTTDDMHEAEVYGVKVLDSVENDKIMALMRVNILTRGRAFLLIEKTIDNDISEHVVRTKKAYSEYKELAEYRNKLEAIFILIFVIFGILILLLAVGAALKFARQLLIPISTLIDSAQKIKEGNLEIRVERDSAIREFKLLSDTFNDMVSEVQQQRIVLENNNKELDQQVQLITKVLSGVSSGVISLTSKLRVHIFNNQAEVQIGKKLNSGMLIFDIFPKSVELFDKIHDSNMVEGQIEYIKDLERHEFTLKISVLKDNDKISGYIITFDDITNIIATQRKAAWADVARRVAHEIKNPLTPIQLATERISRKYSKQITEDFDTFKKLTDTIVKQVGDIRRLADEFSFFARLPEPVLKQCQLYNIAKQAVFFMQNAYQDINISISAIDHDVSIMGDERLIHQAIVNVIQNAINAIKLKGETDSPTINVFLREEAEYISLIIDDNGPGFPKNDRSMLTEPYFTLMPKGTGLGLAIVKKIIQDHGGRIILEDSDMSGARTILSFPLMQQEVK